MIPVITIEGATATGKSNLAIELALALQTEIISADSRQVYRGMDIGTAKVSMADQQRVKHHLISMIDPRDSYHAGAFCKDAELVIAGLHAQNKLPIICGGTGLYVKSLIEGLCPLPEIPDTLRSELQQRLQREGLAALYAQLQAIDPLAAARISGNDPHRTLRALEVFYATGMPLSTHWVLQDSSNRYRCFRILLELPREELYARIEQRLTQMLEMGLLTEIRDLLSMGYTEHTPGLNCLGYKEFIPHIQGLHSLSEAWDTAAQHQRNLAKRQLTWYRKCTFDLTLSASDIKLSDIMTKIENFIVEA